jgi:acyl-CoA thioester hydrolase
MCCRATVRRLKYVESRTRVRYKETDQMGIAHHANYLVWFEIGRTDLCRATGISYPDIESRGYLLVVTGIGCEYRVSFRYDDEVVIRTTLAEWGSRTIKFAYDLYEAGSTEGAPRAHGFSAHVWLDRETRKPVRANEDVAKAFAPWR